MEVMRALLAGVVLTVGCGGQAGHCLDGTGSCIPCSPGNQPGLAPHPPGTYGVGCSGAQAVIIDGLGVCEVLSSLGSAQDDVSFFNEVETQRAWWSSVTPLGRVWLFRECSAGNAYALPARPDIAFGTILYHSLKGKFGMAATEMVIAHELSHRVQHELGFFDPPVPTRTIELEADLFTGFYVGWARDLGESVLDPIWDSVYGIATVEYTHIEHHGTPVQRKAVTRMGYRIAKEAISSGRTPTWHELHAAARQQISELPVGP